MKPIPPAFRQTDVIVLASVLALSLGAWWYQTMHTGPVGGVEILSRGTWRYERLPAVGTRSVTVPGPHGTTAIELSPREARVTSSPCPNHLCISTGALTRPGESVICVPNEVLVRLVGPGADAAAPLDGITQ